MRNVKWWWVAALASVSLSGCFDLDQEITVEKNELTYRAEMKLDAKLAAMANNKNEAFCDDMAQNKPEGIHVEVKESMGGGNLICTITAKGPLEKFNHYVNSEKDNSGMVRVTQLEDGKFRIESRLKNDKQQDMNGMEGMLDAFFAGRTMSWRVNAPKIVESNGQISEDKRHVTWRVPLAQVMKEQMSFYAVIENETSLWQSILNFFASLWERFTGLFASSTPSAPTPTAAAAPAPVQAEAAPSVPAVSTTQASAAQAEAPAAPVVETRDGGEATAPASLVDSDRAEAATGANAIAPLMEPKTSKAVDDEPSAPALAGAQPSTAEPVAAAVAEAQPFAPSFNCAKAQSGQEVLICGDRELARLDVELSVLYRRARSQASDTAALKARQIEWIKYERGACSDKACLVEAYQRRVAELAP